MSAIVCFNVFILGKYYIYACFVICFLCMYYNVLPSKLTHKYMLVLESSSSLLSDTGRGPLQGV